MRRPLLAMGAALAGLAAVASAATAPTPIRVVATIQPIAMLVRELGAGRVAVTSLVPPGASLHTFAPRPGDVAAVEETGLFVEVGAGLDTWAAKLENAAASRPERLVLIELPSLDPLPADPREHGHDAAGARARFDPHVWLDPIRVRDVVAPALVAALVRIDPGGRAEYDTALAALRARIDELDAEIRRTLEGHGTKFVAFHGAWRYFAARYGLEEIGVVEEAPGEEPAPREIARLVEAARAAHVPAILTEPQLNPRIAATIAAELGAGTVTVDEQGDPRDPERADYVALMRFDARAFARALGNGAP
ncbi:MAG TPA: metal ABC transporter substrate-binding protein [Myxococcota bacterium]|nr:metal ABC transporter substrate-binding protein [Myxococcota bacterium]